MSKKVKVMQGLVDKKFVIAVIVFLLFMINEVEAKENYVAKDTIEDEKYENKLNELYDYALSFGKYVGRDNSIVISGIDRIYDKNGVCEYCFNYEKNGVSYGYAVYNLHNKDITLFSIENKHPGLYGKIINSVYDREVKKLKVIFKNSELDYYAVFTQNDEISAVNSNGDIIDINELNEIGYSGISTYKYDDIFDISGKIPDSIVYTHYLKTENYLVNPARYGENYITNYLKEPYACAVTAMLNVCANNRFFDVTSEKSRKKAYEDLWLLSGTKYNNNTGDYVTDKSKMGSSVAMFARQNKGISVNYTRSNNPSLSFFTSAVNKGYSSILGITTSCTNGNHTGIAGHAYSVIGYKIFEPSRSNYSKKIYLRVATGWGTLGDEGYILYNNINVISKYGVVWKYKPKVIQ